MYVMCLECEKGVYVGVLLGAMNLFCCLWDFYSSCFPLMRRMQRNMNSAILSFLVQIDSKKKIDLPLRIDAFGQL